MRSICILLVCLILWCYTAGAIKVSLEASQSKSRADELAYELEALKEGLDKSNSRAKEMEERHSEGQ